ncbi:hypothetical protein MNBD_ALPHA06-1598 [hydrothermal vent metagenome]|uniref:Uncharacterized protein n=1 Tax=hydrothermal vent metagenome TaxID=652676 RepID=A0A3B0SRW9_9ZZZZ
MIEFFLSIIEALFQGFMALVLGVFGFTWSAPEQQKEDEAVTTAIVRIQEMLMPVVLPLQLRNTAARDTKTDCAKGKTTPHTVDMPVVIAVPARPISS